MNLQLSISIFLWRPLSCGGPWATAQFVPLLKSGPVLWRMPEWPNLGDRPKWVGPLNVGAVFVCLSDPGRLLSRRYRLAAQHDENAPQLLVGVQHLHVQRILLLSWSSCTFESGQLSMFRTDIVDVNVDELRSRLRRRTVRRVFRRRLRVDCVAVVIETNSVI